MRTKGTVYTFDTGELLWIMRHSAFRIDASLVTDLSYRIDAVVAKILTSTVMTKSFRRHTEESHPLTKYRPELILSAKTIQPFHVSVIIDQDKYVSILIYVGYTKRTLDVNARAYDIRRSLPTCGRLVAFAARQTGHSTLCALVRIFAYGVSAFRRFKEA